MRRTMDEGRAARHGAFVAAIVLLAAGLWVPAASGDQGGKPHEGSHGNGAQGAPGHQSAPAEQPGDESGDDQGGPAKQHDDGDDEGRPEHAAKPEHEGRAKHKAKLEHAGRPEHSAPSKSHPTPNGNPGKTTICHRTGSEKHPWVTITVADRALPAHRRHGDLIPAPAGGCPAPAAAPSDQKAEPAKPGDAKENAQGKHGKTTICHRTGSESNPWVLITVADPALKAHRKHGDIIPAPAEGCPKPQPAATTAPAAPTPGGETAPAPVVSLGMGTQVPLPVTAQSQSPPAGSAPAASAPAASTPFRPGGTVTTVSAPSRSTATKTASAAPRGEVLAETASSSPTAAQAATDTGSRLPFTGLAVWLLALGGAGALVAGVALRRAHGMRR